VLLLVVACAGPLVIGQNCCSDMPAIIDDLQQEIEGLKAQIKKISGDAGKERCPPGFDFLPAAKGCYKLLKSKQSWDSSLDMCKNLGSRLVIINSQLQNDAIVNYIKMQGTDATVGCKEGIWIGAKRRDGTCQSPMMWKTPQGDNLPMTFTWWHQNTPDCMFNKEQCGHFFTNNYLLFNALTGWDDFPCNFNLCPLCQA